ncbi:DinB family protein [Fluviicola chungangensis]|uniref:DinB family protein n=1 Tax=Fluviicola chungangensis TaxID=2597671 RepID=A0A556N704_9FLAO|nr:DinB family protein [Fluviicola chungangensis]TSJ47935.1 DinB family protein [Fluviicola chungangensis]
MSISKQLAKHLRDVHFGGNWTVTDLRSTLSDVKWEDALTQVYSLNSIAALTVHMTYYVNVLITVLEENKLTGKDEMSWLLPAIRSKEDWEELLEGIWQRAEKAASLIEQLPDEQLTRDFFDPKYGTNYRNIAGIVEHMHYHLGQIVIIKKLIVQ